MKSFWDYIMWTEGMQSLVAFIKDVLCRVDLQLANCRGQCYDGAAVMSGSRSGVATRIMEVNNE